MIDEAVHLKNKHVYNQRKIIEEVARYDDLCVSERAIVDRFEQDLRGKAILDLGVGTGRTTPALRALASTYVGVDYAKEMVATCRARFPGVDFREGDARRLEMFADGSFDAVFFCASGIDHVMHEDRLMILREVRRVLREGGLFVFSTHNLGFKRRSPFLPWPMDPHPGLCATIIGAAQHLVGYMTGIVNALQNRRYERRGDGWAFLVDQAYHYGIVLYHTSIPHQIAQLASVGFTTLELMKALGGALTPDASYDGPWVYYVARKMPESRAS